MPLCSNLNVVWKYIDDCGKNVLPLTYLLRKILIDGYDSFSSKENPSKADLDSLKECEKCIDSVEIRADAVDGEGWANYIDAHRGRLSNRSRVDILLVLCIQGNAKVLLVEGKLGCVENRYGNNAYPRFRNLKVKYEDTILRLKELHLDGFCGQTLYLVVNGGYYNQTKWRVNMWKKSGFNPVVKCMCIAEIIALVECCTPISACNILKPVSA